MHLNSPDCVAVDKAFSAAVAEQSGAPPAVIAQAAAKAAGLRIEIDPGGRSVSKQIKIANQDKVPLYAVVGEREIAGQSLSFMYRKDGALLDLGAIPYQQAVSILELAAKEGADKVDDVLAIDTVAA